MDDYTITSWHVDEDKDGKSVLTMSFIPWVTGNIQLPPIAGEMLPPMTVVPMSPSVGDNVTIRAVFRPGGGEALLPPVKVVSVLQQGVGGAELHPPQGPLLSPITIHALYASVALMICVLAVLCVVFTKWHKMYVWLLIRAMEATERRNTRMLKKRLGELLKDGADDAPFCAELQMAIRSYLNARFDDDLSAFTTDEVASMVAVKTTAVSSPQSEEAYNDVIGVLRRADYVRFAGAALEAHEREDLVQRIINALDVLKGNINA